MRLATLPDDLRDEVRRRLFNLRRHHLSVPAEALAARGRA